MSGFTPIMITKPIWFRIKPTTLGFGKRPPYVIGWDTEAYKGRPMLMQFSLPGQSMQETGLVWTTAKTCLEDFLAALEEVALPHARTNQVVVFGWNLQYEYTQLFRMIPPEWWQSGEIKIHYHDTGLCEQSPNDDWDVSIEALNLKRYAMTIQFRGSRDSRPGRNRRDRYPIRVIDGMAFFNTGLDKAAKIIGIEGKDDYPDELKGKLPPSKAIHDQRFLDYSKRDAFITRQLGEKIIEYHQAFDVRMTISAPMYAAYVFKRKYLDGEIPLCEPDLEAAGLASYHGGKNGFYLDRPAYFANAWDYDVNAAYTSAMAELPDPVTSMWEEVSDYEPSATHALWRVAGWVRSCDYRAFQKYTGRWITHRQDGEAVFWITSYELTEAMARGEIELHHVWGFVLRGESGQGSIRRFCDDMYRLKQYGKTAEERQMAKLCLNSLYGKLIQKTPIKTDGIPFYDWAADEQGIRKIVDLNQVEGGYKAGGLYHPALASLVTGSVRARIHAYEHKYRSLMTSTDGFLSTVPPDPGDIGTGFGTLKVKQGSLKVWRERLYLFETDDHAKCDHDRGVYDCRAFALHGFRGRLADLTQVPLEPGRYKYKATQMIGLRDSMHEHGGRRYEPGQFATIPFELDLTTVNARSPIRVA